MGHLKLFQSNPLPVPAPQATNAITPQTVVITRRANVLTLAGPDDAPLDPVLIKKLTHDLRYEHVENLSRLCETQPDYRSARSFLRPKNTSCSASRTARS
jgi:hypothetical protein